MHSTTGALASTLGTIQPFRYRGYVYDVETGLYYLRSRYYDPIWQRFINRDSHISSEETVLGLNMFAYCINSPLAFIDPDGFYSVNPFPWTSTPFDFRISTGDNGITYWRWYDSQGRAYVDRHFTDHGNPFKHSNPHDQKYLYDSEGNRYKTEHYNHFDDDGKFINEDNNNNDKNDRWPGQDEWEKEKEEYEKSQESGNQNDSTKDILIGGLALGIAWSLFKIGISVFVPGGVLVWALP